jgi:hypothetical protein
VIHLQLIWNQSKGISPVLRELAAIKSLAVRVEPPVVQFNADTWRCQIRPRGVWLKRIDLDISTTDRLQLDRAPAGWRVEKNGSHIFWQAESEETESAQPIDLSLSVKDLKKEPGVISITYAVDGSMPEERSEQFTILTPT